MKKEEISKKLLQRCYECAYGGCNIFPDYLDFDPITSCIYFDDINDDDLRDEDYYCKASMYIDAYQKLKEMLKITTNYNIF